MINLAKYGLFDSRGIIQDLEDLVAPYGDIGIESSEISDMVVEYLDAIGFNKSMVRVYNEHSGLVLRVVVINSDLDVLLDTNLKLNDTVRLM